MPQDFTTEGGKQTPHNSTNSTASRPPGAKNGSGLTVTVPQGCDCVVIAMSNTAILVETEGRVIN